MARTLRVQFPGAVYHVMFRGVARRRMFFDDRDRERLLRQLAARVEPYQVRLYLFVWMSNHIHLVLETGLANLNRFMQSLETAYTVYFNTRHRLAGHVVQGRYKPKLVEADPYLLQLTRYVHLNPVCTRAWQQRSLSDRRRSLRQYRWSSYRSYAGLAPALDFVDYAPLTALVAGGDRTGRRRYREFVEEGLAREDKEFQELMEASPLAIGTEPFRAWVEKRYADLVAQAQRPTDVQFARLGRQCPPEKVLETVARALGVQTDQLKCRRRGVADRGITARMKQYAGLNHRQIARELGLESGAAVGWQLRQLEERCRLDKRVRRAVEELHSQFRALG